MRITISGLPGSGKTTTGQLLAKKLGLRFVSVGEIFRQMASERKMSLADFSKYAEQHPEIDTELDKRTMEFSKKENNFVIEGRLVAWMCKADLKAWLEASIERRAGFVATRTNQVQETKELMLQREKSEAKRYKEFHNIDLNDKSVYDLIVDSEHLNVPQMVEKIISEVRKRKLG